MIPLEALLVSWGGKPGTARERAAAVRESAMNVNKQKSQLSFTADTFLCRKFRKYQKQIKIKTTQERNGYDVLSS